MSLWKIFAEIIAFFALIFALAWIALKTHVEPLEHKSGMKRLSGTVADGFVYMSPKEPFPRITFDACRVGKVKVGVFALAPFSTVELDNLVVNIPPSNGDIAQKMLIDGGHASESVPNSVESNSNALGLKVLASMARGRFVGRLYSIKVNGFSLSKMIGKNLEPIIEARRLRSSGRKMLVEGLTLHDADGVKHISEAELVTKPVLSIVWAEGKFELSELSLMFEKSVFVETCCQ